MSNDKHVCAVYIKAEPEVIWEALTTPEFTRRYFHATEIKSDWKQGSVVRSDDVLHGVGRHLPCPFEERRCEDASSGRSLGQSDSSFVKMLELGSKRRTVPQRQEFAPFFTNPLTALLTIGRIVRLQRV